MQYKIKNGSPAPLGSTPGSEGVNFSLYAKDAEAVELWLFKNADDIGPFQIVKLDADKNKSSDYWHVFIEGAKHGLYYGYKIHGRYDPGSGLLFDGSKLLSDPCARVLYGKNYSRKEASEYGFDNTSTAIKSMVAGPDEYDWEGDEHPGIPLGKSLIYELHVKGFTAHESSGVPDKEKGSFQGLIHKIPYLKGLGVNAVELMPVFAFDEQDAPAGLKNYWGYSPIGFFSLHWAYGTGGDPVQTIREFKDMVKAMHRAGMEVILDVVYNHTAEAWTDGPWHNLKGQAAKTYYIHRENKFACYTGCGNTLNTNNAVVARMINGSLRYWVEEMHVDGFRFDLASVFMRGEDGSPVDTPLSLALMESAPSLASVKLIAEPWDAAGYYRPGYFAGRSCGRWAEWNGVFRDDVRKFVKSDKGMVPAIASRLSGSPDVYGNTSQGINFIACHDGFTMNDLVSYNHKHNEANRWGNTDGADDNHSWNCGVEGPSNDHETELLRRKQLRNFFAVLFLAQGRPMLSMGDELLRTQRGNNNAYCQDNEISWINWRQDDEFPDFVCKLSQFTGGLALFSLDEALHVGYNASKPYLLWHGTKLNEADWSEESRTLASELFHPERNEHLYVVYNMFWEDMSFMLPKPVKGKWRLAVDTSSPKNFQQEEINGTEIMVRARSVMVLLD